MVDSISADTLTAASEVLERDAALLRRSMQRNYDAADPIPGVEREKKLAAVLRQAAELPPQERQAFLATTLRIADLKEIDLVRKGLVGTTVHEDPRELAARAAAGSVLSDLLHELRPVLKR